ncbi:uncharacterized protein ACA1_072050 [Acanthamoeba castellanii str. Neff]|uniref:Uncharacterized protein n=1 Tax=Acanthamoeba castellanii (strain ATCC 30010 / Neff) TaxID=1257118 RepID=L8HFU7_ACACF|nr:uncharacterized protein ACA1_072050 [Acanthamoeba castellanii str. Neff]ELR23583.1 hypothetical protein ACA1_072050 [Acanthamoeba castellanii str. Neff]
MKSLHLKKLAGVGEKMRTWGKSSDSDHGGHHHSSHHHHHSHSQPPPHQHHPPPPLPPRATSPPPPDEFTLGSCADEGLDIDALADQPALLGSPPPSSSSSSSDVDPWEPPTSTPDATTTTVGSSGHEEATNLLDDTPLLPELPPLPRPSTSKRRSSVPHILSRRSREAERSSPPTTAPDLLLLDINGGGHQQHQQGTGHGAVMTSVGSATSGEKGQRLEEKIKELKLKDLALREDRNKERERRKEAEHQLKAAQKERYIQGLKVKYLETKLEKVGGNKSDMEKRVRKESQANASLQKEVDVLRSKLAERERALAERDDGLGRLKRQYTRLKNGGSDDCSLEELEELEKVLDKSRNTVVERIKQKVKEEVEDKSKCLICFDSNQVKNCPICRANIEIKQKVFE